MYVFQRRSKPILLLNNNSINLDYSSHHELYPRKCKFKYLFLVLISFILFIYSLLLILYHPTLRLSIPEYKFNLPVSLEHFLERLGLISPIPYLIENNNYFYQLRSIDNTVLQSQADNLNNLLGNEETVAAANNYQLSRPFNASFVYLLNARRVYHMYNLCHSLRGLYYNFNKDYNYPILIFHEDNLLPFHKRFLTQCYPLTSPYNNLTNPIQPISFIQIDLLEDIYPVHLNSIRGGMKRIGYKCMIRWYLIHIFDHPAIRDLNYYWRLDTDSFIAEPINYDPFQIMYEKNLFYSYRVLDEDEPPIIQGLYQTIQNYIQHNNIQLKNSLPTSPLDGRDQGFEPFIFPDISYSNSSYMPVIYNNLELVNVQFFRQNTQIQQFTNYIDKLDGIFKYQWGDAAIRYWQLQMFVESDQILKFSDWDYVHSRPHAKLNNSFPYKIRYYLMRQIKVTMVIFLALSLLWFRFLYSLRHQRKQTKRKNLIKLIYSNLTILLYNHKAIQSCVTTP
jgi:hypothetical protein